MKNIEFIDTKNLKFQHTSNGVIAKYKDKKFILGYSSIGNQNEHFTDSQLSQYAQQVLNFQCSVRKLPKHEITSQKIFSNGLIENDFGPFYKYVKPETYNKYIKKGRWQLGCVQQYREIENQLQRDEFEGYSFINLNINNHLVSTVCNSGFNYLIFCGTDKDNSSLHKAQFGEKQISIPNVKSFAEAIRKAINAKSYHIHKVTYDSVKLYINREIIYNNEITLENILVEPFFEILKKNILYPSLFVKPEKFKPENETRIVFEMHKDYDRPLKFDNIGLNYYINR